MTGTLVFSNIKFYGFHGLHPEEAKVGTYFIINIKAVLKTDFEKENPSLENSVDYEILYSVLKKAFDQRENLIETVALNIYTSLKNQFHQVEKWTVGIEKQNPLGVAGINPEFCIER
ncbi:MAG: dihydroneopterin aldolase [Bacteroidia bacterium]